MIVVSFKKTFAVTLNICENKILLLKQNPPKTKYENPILLKKLQSKMQSTVQLQFLKYSCQFPGNNKLKYTIQDNEIPWINYKFELPLKN